MKLLPALMLLVALPAAGQATVERSRLVGLSASVVKIEARRAQGGYSLGSGVAVAPNKVVTNCHVTRDAVSVQVQRGGVRWDADAQASQPELDLCVLRVPALRAEAVELGESQGLHPGDPVAALGYTGGAGLQVSDGDVIALHRHAGGSVIQSSNWFTSGASGGGLFDQRLRLVGVLTFRLRGGATHYFAAPAEWLKPLLNEGTAFRPLAPLTDAPAPYWQEAAARQPLFLQAAALEQATQWPELLKLSTDWSQADPADAEPWYLRGLSLERMDRLDESRSALETAVQREATWLPAWHRLGLVLVRQGRLEEARRALSRLQGRQTLLADDLQHALDRACAVASRPAQCPVEPA